MPPSSSLLLAEGLQKSAQHLDKGKVEAAAVCLNDVSVCVGGWVAAGHVCVCNKCCGRPSREQTGGEGGSDEGRANELLLARSPCLLAMRQQQVCHTCTQPQTHRHSHRHTHSAAE